MKELDLMVSVTKKMEALEENLKEVKMKQSELLDHGKFQERQIKSQVAIALINNSGFSKDTFFTITDAIFQNHQKIKK